MASTYSDLKIELIGTGEQTGTWGATTNTNLSTALGEAITGSADVAFSSSDVTVTLTNTNAAQTARNLRLNLTGTSGGARQLILGSGCQIEKLYLINNGLADAVTVKNTTGTGIAVPAGKSMFVYNNGTNVVDATTHLSSLTLSTPLPITSGGTGTSSTAYVNLASNVTGTLPIANGGTGTTSTTFVNLTTNVTGTLPIANGGTNATSAPAARTSLGATTLGSNVFTITNPSAITFPRFNADNTVSALDAASFRTAIGAGTGGGSVSSVSGTGTVNGITLTGTVTSTGSLTLGGTLTGVNLATQVTGTLPVANGGTGATTLTTNNVLLGNGTSALQVVAPGTTGNVLTSNGTTWTSAAAGGGGQIGQLQDFQGPTTTTYPGSTWLLCNGSTLTQTAYPSLYSTIGLIQNNFDFVSRGAFSGTLLCAAFGNGVYAAAGAGTGGNATLITSTDAITWTTRNSGVSSVNIFAMTYGDSGFVYAGGNGEVRRTTDFINVFGGTSGTSSSITSLTFGNGIYVYGGNGGVLATSTNGTTWTTRTSGTTSSITSLTFGNGIYVYGGNGGVLATSTNAITWTARTSGTSSTINSLIYANGLYAYSIENRVATSTDAITWTVRTVSSNSGLGLAYGNNLYVVVGSSSASSSSDAITWSTLSLGATTTANAVIFGNNIFAAATQVATGSTAVVRSYTPFAYNQSTEFVLPTTTINATSLGSKLFIKAT